MRPHCGALVIAISVLSAPLPAFTQQLYRWIDTEGRVHYSEQAPAPNAAKSVEKKHLGASVVETPMPFALQQAARSYPVVLYTSASCKQGCTEARELLETRGVPFHEVAVADLATVEALKKATGDNKVPALTVGSDIATGFDADVINAALDAAGYPRTRLYSVKPPEAPHP